ncbi:ATP-binding protein [Streptomyces sp. NPDC006784]|uniref:ATP-binding protein n=1 Tax=Streptomyces sp. NPDC006784 TaxID=3364764 RepID=UPI0036D170DF
MLVDTHQFNLSHLAAPESLARRAVREALNDRAGKGRVDDAVLVTGEIVGNAVRHAGGAAPLALGVYEHGAMIEVTDRGTDTTVIPSAPSTPLVGQNKFGLDTIDVESLPETGHGLFIVAQCVTAWRVKRVEIGKAVIAAPVLPGRAT